MNRMVWIAVIAVGGVAVLALGAWIVAGLVPVAGIETPAYEVAEEKEGYEIRVYAAHIVAEVTVEGDFDGALNRGFQKVADYIFGNNTAADGASAEIAMTAPVQEQATDKGEKIAMTAPVQEASAAGEDAHRVAFVMPSKYTMETLPKPNNDEVQLVEVPEKRYAVIRFSGTMNGDKSAERKAAFLEQVKGDGYTVVGEPLLCQYNPPWTPPFMRRNEIWIEVM